MVRSVALAASMVFLPAVGAVTLAESSAEERRLRSSIIFYPHGQRAFIILLHLVLMVLKVAEQTFIGFLTSSLMMYFGESFCQALITAGALGSRAAIIRKCKTDLAKCHSEKMTSYTKTDC